ncbi:hypothetical protein [Enterococcus casseliflavus]|uniref:hypothetical protein n=1 Tax=Enterococcus casseliflavus TaxID=37734 RepID=UPI00115D99F6|nr:hypothetical protein [Enterococcus casseliflavus]
MDKFKYKSSDINGTSLIFKIDEVNKNIVTDLFKLSEGDYKYNLSKSMLEIFNSNKKLFLEEIFLLSDSLEFETLLKRYRNKDFSNIDFFYVDEGVFHSSSRNFEEEKSLYAEFLENNNIVTNGIKENNLLIPPSLFSELKKTNYTNNMELEPILKYLSEVFSLFMLADKSKINFKDDNIFFEFSIYCEKKENHMINVEWKKWSYFKTNLFYKCYEWILNKINNNFKNKTLLQVVKQFLGNLDSLENVDDITNSLDSILNRIILNETHEYFLQQNKLKDEFIMYKKMDMESNNSLMKSLLGLITTIGLAYYSKVITMDNYKFNETSESLAIIFVFGMIAIMFFCYSYTLNYFQRKEYYTSLRNIYLEKFVFSEKDFDSILVKPTLFKGHYRYWITLLCFYEIVLVAILFYIGVI